MGDTKVGKTCFIKAFGGEKEFKGYTKTDIDGCSFTTTREDGKKVTLEIIDTSGDHAMSPLRMLASMDADCVIVFFSTVDPESFKNAYTYWKEEA